MINVIRVILRRTTVRSLSETSKKFLHVYFTGEGVSQARVRCKNKPGVKEHVVLDLQEVLNFCNGYVKEFKTAVEKLFK